MLPTTYFSWPSISTLTLDVLVTASGTPIPCNKSALVSSSGYFSNQLNLQPSLNSSGLPSLHLPTVPADIFRTLLSCMYTGKLDCTTETVYQLFWYAQMLQIPSAVLQCTQFLSSKLSPATNILNEKPSSPPTQDSTKPIVIKPIARQGVPLLSSIRPTLLRPHLASFYSDWFLRYSTLTRNENSSLDVSTGENDNSKENQGNP